MSDCISFCVAPALLMFVMFGRWGEASPLWSVSLGIAACWIIVTGMLRLARFQHEDGSGKNYFHGMASPGNAMILLTVAAMIWLQPSSGFGPDVTTNCIFCFESTSSSHEKPYFDFLILPVMFISGALMISDRKLSKAKKGIPMKLSALQLLSIVSATILSILNSTEVGENLLNTKFQFVLYGLSAILLIIYVVAGPKIVDMDSKESFESE